MAKFPTYEEMGKKVAEKALDEFLYDGRSIREWMQIIASEDCISRQEVLDALDKSKYSNEFCEEHHIDWSINLGMAHIVVNELKPITPQPKIGHWINLEETKYKGQVLPFWSRYECSKCGGHGEGTFNYCPNCGTDMRESEV